MIKFVTENNYNHNNLFCCNQMHPIFRFDEKILTNIVHRYIYPLQKMIIE